MKHIIIDWSNVCHRKNHWKNNNWKDESDFNTIKEILNLIERNIPDPDDLNFYIIFPHSGKNFPSSLNFSAGLDSVTFPDIADKILNNVEIFWPGGFNLTEKSPQHKIDKFKDKCPAKKNNPLHSCSSPDDLFILWKAAEIGDIDNTYIITDDKFGSEKTFIRTCNQNDIQSLSDLVQLCNYYSNGNLPAVLVKKGKEYTWQDIDKKVIRKNVPFIDVFNKLMDNSVNIISSKVITSDKSNGSQSIKAGQKGKKKTKSTITKT